MKKIPLRKLVNGKQTIVCHALIDDDDFDLVGGHRWHLSQWGYAATNIKTGDRYVMTFMHRMVNKTPNGLFTDHINGDSIDNQKCNLRTVSGAKNAINRSVFVNNTSGYKGVTWHKKTRQWRAGIGLNGRRIYLGLYDSAEEAAMAYEKAAKTHHGEFARK